MPPKKHKFIDQRLQDEIARLSKIIERCRKRSARLFTKEHVAKQEYERLRNLYNEIKKKYDNISARAAELRNTGKHGEELNRLDAELDDMEQDVQKIQEELEKARRKHASLADLLFRSQNLGREFQNDRNYRQQQLQKILSGIEPATGMVAITTMVLIARIL